MLTVVTNSPLFTKEMQEYTNSKVIMIGGTLRKETGAIVDPFVEKLLSNIRVDKAFIATNALDVEEGLTTPNVTHLSNGR